MRMDRFWIKQYPPGTPADIDPNEYTSLKQLIDGSCRQFADRTAYIQMERRLSYAQLDQLSSRFAAWLQQRGLRKGERVAIMLPNILQYPIVMFGALRAGLTVVNTNPLYTATELEHQLRDSGATALVVLENFAAVAQQTLAAVPVPNVVVTGVGDLLGFPKGALVNFVLRHVQRKVPSWSIPHARSLGEVLTSAPAVPTPVDVGHDDIAYLQYTGGTTGVSKGAMLTHGNMVANILQARAWFKQVEIENTTYVCALPLYHIFSLTANCLLFSSLGGTGHLITNPRDFPGFVKELRRHPPMFFMGVNTLFNALMNTPGFSALDFSRLVATVGGGMAVQRAVAERWQRVTGCVVTQGWGLTEASPAVCVNPLVGVPFTGAVGLPLSSTEVTIRDDDGKDVGLNTSGELCARGPQVMRGYWQRPEETAKVMLPDGWLRTGDIGRMDDRGYVFIEDRKKDMIIVSGFKVFPNEVEDVVAHHPGVAEVAAVAQADERSGEVVALFIVKKDPALTADEILEYCHKSLTGYKMPRHIYFRDSLPKTNVGKILRRALRDELVSPTT
ncbi:MAG: AMP-binding protein [Gammaproteobacteria bacterium]|nr:AMP-binding protein [Gammaproteobacteria bacterium]